MPVRWNSAALKRELVKTLAANGEVAGRFVEGEAKRRITGISDPDWGRQYRNFVATLLDTEVKVGVNEVTIIVGVRRAYTRYHGLYIELGTSRRPAAPFLRPSVFQNGKKIVALLAGR